MIRTSIRRSAAGNGIGLATKVDGVDHAVLIGVDEVNAFAFGQQGKGECFVRPKNKAARLNDSSVGNAELVCVRIVGEPGAGKVHGRVAVIVQFQRIVQRRIGVCQPFVDDDGINGLTTDRIGAAGRAIDTIALRPRADVIFTKRRAREDERMAPLVGGNWPGNGIGVIHFEEQRVVATAELHRALSGWQTAGLCIRPRAVDVVDGIVRHHELRLASQDEELTRCHDGAGRKNVIHRASDRTAADVFGPGAGIVDLDELEAFVSGGDDPRIVHQLADHQAGFPAGGAKRLVFVRNLSYSKPPVQNDQPKD